MHRLHVAVLLTILLICSCRGYKGKSNPLAPEEVQISDLATALKDSAAGLQADAPAELKESIDGLADATALFQNFCLRFGSNSLESRKAFDKVMYYDAQITQSPALSANAAFLSRWNELRTAQIQPLARKLGYRPEN